MYSIADIVSLFLAFCGGISALGAASVYIAKAVGWIRKPEEHQNALLADHEKRITSLETKVNSDYSSIQKLQKEVKLMLKAVVAIMTHELDGNHTDDLQKALKDINNYLLEK